eukprot:m.24441 g.24441  ORF g.24441 m.24441 type:complete len:561 (-) comp14609_c0_seq1:35-1717(-)
MKSSSKDAVLKIVSFVLQVQVICATHILSSEYLTPFTPQHGGTSIWWDKPNAEALKLQKDLQGALESNQNHFFVQDGNYSFGATPLILQNGAKTIVSFSAGATLWFAVGGGVQLMNCDSIQFVGATIDYYPTLAQGIVVSFSPGSSTSNVAQNMTLNTPPSFIADFDSNFLLPDPAVSPFFNQSGSIKVAFWNPNNNTMIRTDDPGAINLFAKSFNAVGSGTRYNIVLMGNMAQLPQSLATGSLVTVFPRGGRHSLVLLGCHNVSVVDTTIYGGSSMGVVETGGGGMNSYTRLRITRRPALWAHNKTRFLAVNADGFHSTSNNIGPHIKNSEVSFTGDDLANICSGMSVLLKFLPNNTALMVNTGTLQNGRSGDVVSFYNLSTKEQLGSLELLATPQPTQDPALVAVMRAAFATMQAPPYNAHFVNEVQGQFENHDPYLVRFTTISPVLKQRLQPLWSLTVLEATDNSGAIVENSKFHNGYARAFMIKGRDSIFEENAFAASGGIHVGPETVWLEGDPGIKNVSIIDNTLQRLGVPPISLQPGTSPAVAYIHNNTILPNF